MRFSEAYEPTYSFETAVEAFYRVSVFEWFSLKPDLQYVIHPGGKDTDNAFAATMRLEAHL